jgi:hypothetical protein
MNRPRFPRRPVGPALLALVALIALLPIAPIAVPHAAAEDAPAPPKASAVFENLQVLGDLPADQLRPAMEFFEAALGGREAIDAVRSRRMVGTLTTSRGDRFGLEIVRATPGRVIETRRAEVAATRTGFDGETAWRQRGDEPPEIAEGERLEAARPDAVFPAPPGLRDAPSEYFVLGREALGDREVVVLEGPAPPPNPDDARERLYFDTGTGLLHRVLALSPTPLGDVPRATDYDDYREVDGVQVPFEVRTAAIDFVATRRFETIESNVEVDESAFAPPQSP